MPQLNNNIPRTVTAANAELFPFILSLLEKGHTATLRLRGNSMRPFLESERDAALLTLARPPFHVGEPVLAELSPGRFVLHRIIAISPTTITLLGDGNLIPETCPPSAVKAQVLGFYRKNSTHLTSTSSASWRLYSALWRALRPVRRPLLAVHRRWLRYFGSL